MAACVNGVAIIQDRGKALAAFPKIGAHRPCFDLKLDLLSGLAQRALDRALLGQRGQTGLFRSSSTQGRSFHAAPER
jgi:hypothetical protein